MQDVLFNFVGFNKVTVGNWQSSLLAAAARLAISNGALNGSAFVGSFTGGGELHNDPFNGTIPDGPANIPEPATAALFGFAIVALAVATRRRLAGSRMRHTA